VLLFVFLETEYIISHEHGIFRSACTGVNFVPIQILAINLKNTHVAQWFNGLNFRKKQQRNKFDEVHIRKK